MKLIDIAQRLRADVDAMSFSAPITHVLDPLDYAWPLHRAYLERFGAGLKDAVFLGMNPGPWGMAQTGVPFGEVAAVRDWMGLTGDVRRPTSEHPKRPVTGLECPRSEVSGRRLWGWAADRFGSPDAFFARFFVINYCPLVFLEATGRNRTPDKLPKAERGPLEAVCDRALREQIEVLRPRLVIGVGAWAEKRARAALAGVEIDGQPLRFGRILHPSPASPAANRGWAPQAEAQLIELGVIEG